MCFYGSEEMGIRADNLSVHLMVAAWEWPSYMSPEAKKKGISIIKSPYQQYENPLYSNNKIIGTYINSIMALHDALAKNADEAILMDKNGFISEGSGENLFIIKGSKLMTPKTDFCLNGLTRQSVLQIAINLKIEVEEADLTFDDLLESDEAFFSGTAVEITPITRVNETTIGSGTIGPMTEILQSKYLDIVCGNDAQYAHWLTAI
mgnify:CR=1 FL=1